MTPTITFRNMLDDAAVLSLECQLYLSDLLGEHRWNVDLEQSRFEFTGDHPLICRVFHMLGSAAPGPRSWLWSWANPSIPATLTGLAAALADFGRSQQIGQLTSPEVPFAELPGTPLEPHQAVAPMIEAAKVFSGRWFAYNGDAGGGTRAAFLLEHPEFVLPEPDPARVLRVLSQSVADALLVDHRRALSSYAQRRGLGAAFNADYTELVITGPQLRVRAEFDRFGRTASIDAGLG